MKVSLSHRLGELVNCHYQPREPKGAHKARVAPPTASAATRSRWRFRWPEQPAMLAQRRVRPPLLHATHSRAYGSARNLALGIGWWQRSHAP